MKLVNKSWNCYMMKPLKQEFDLHMLLGIDL